VRDGAAPSRLREGAWIETEAKREEVMSDEIEWSDPAPMTNMVVNGVYLRMVDGNWVADDGTRFQLINNGEALVLKQIDGDGEVIVTIE
jgi:hypothetical protein